DENMENITFGCFIGRSAKSRARFDAEFDAEQASSPARSVLTALSGDREWISQFQDSDDDTQRVFHELTPKYEQGRVWAITKEKMITSLAASIHRGHGKRERVPCTPSRAPYRRRHLEGNEAPSVVLPARSV